MEWITVIGFVLFGIGLIIVEILFVPGTTIVGLLGFAGLIIGIYLGYAYFDKTVGTIILLASGVASLGLIVWAFRADVWDRFSLKQSIDSKFNEEVGLNLKIGDIGKSISALKPIGKAEFSNEEFEVKTAGEYLDAGEPVKIIKLERNNIYVEKS